MNYQLQNLTIKDKEKISDILKKGGIGVMPSDTIYGIFTSALNPKSIEKIYQLRKRSKLKPLIILISTIDDLKLFNIKITNKTKSFLEKNWPNPLSVILNCPNKNFEYLHRSQKTLAFRIPKFDFLIEVLKKSGPLVAPSANFENEKPAETINDAKKYFKDSVDFYIDGGSIYVKPSTIIEINSHSITILRQGLYQITNLMIDNK